MRLYAIHLMIFLWFIPHCCIFQCSTDDQQKKKISGTITEENGNPLPGATVMIEGTTVGTVSDANGKFTDRVYR